MEGIKKDRNTTIDVIRGLAMLLVVLGHTMIGCVNGATDSFLFQIVWSLQMPLFMLISGYVSKYSKDANNATELRKQLIKKTIAYLLPWCVWTFMVRGTIGGQTSFWNIGWLAFHMDCGYWFLFSIWNIVVIFILASYFSRKTNHPLMVEIALYLLGMIILGGVAALAGLSFLGIKLTLYYMPFYFLGHLYSVMERYFHDKNWFQMSGDVIVVGCLAVWLSSIFRVNIYELSESFFDIVLRFGVSMSGCIAVAGLLSNIKDYLFWKRGNMVLEWCGKNSLQIYLTHGFFLNLLRYSERPLWVEPMGIMLVFGNFCITLVLCSVLIQLIEKNKLLRLILFDKF